MMSPDSQSFAVFWKKHVQLPKASCLQSDGASSSIRVRLHSSSIECQSNCRIRELHEGQTSNRKIGREGSHEPHDALVKRLKVELSAREGRVKDELTRTVLAKYCRSRPSS